MRRWPLLPALLVLLTFAAPAVAASDPVEAAVGFGRCAADVATHEGSPSDDPHARFILEEYNATFVTARGAYESLWSVGRGVFAFANQDPRPLDYFERQADPLVLGALHDGREAGAPAASRAAYLYGPGYDALLACAEGLEGAAEPRA